MDFLVKHGYVLDTCPSLSSSKDLDLNTVVKRGAGHDDMNMYYEQGVIDAGTKALESMSKGDVTLPLQ